MEVVFLETDKGYDIHLPVWQYSQFQPPKATKLARWLHKWHPSALAPWRFDPSEFETRTGLFPWPADFEIPDHPGPAPREPSTRLTIDLSRPCFKCLAHYGALRFHRIRLATARPADQDDDSSSGESESDTANCSGFARSSGAASASIGAPPTQLAQGRSVKRKRDEALTIRLMKKSRLKDEYDRRL